MNVRAVVATAAFALAAVAAVSEAQPAAAGPVDASFARELIRAAVAHTAVRQRGR